MSETLNDVLKAMEKQVNDDRMFLLYAQRRQEFDSGKRAAYSIAQLEGFLHRIRKALPPTEAGHE